MEYIYGRGFDYYLEDAGNLEIFKELKSLFSQPEWIKVHEEIFIVLSKYVKVDKLYQEEKLFDRLLENVLNINELNILYKYEDDLKKLRPKIILQRYVDEINVLTRYTAGRKRYQKWVYNLRRI